MSIKQARMLTYFWKRKLVLQTNTVCSSVQVTHILEHSHQAAPSVETDQVLAHDWVPCDLVIFSMCLTNFYCTSFYHSYTFMGFIQVPPYVGNPRAHGSGSNRSSAIVTAESIMATMSDPDGGLKEAVCAARLPGRVCFPMENVAGISFFHHVLKRKR